MPPWLYGRLQCACNIHKTLQPALSVTETACCGVETCTHCVQSRQQMSCFAAQLRQLVHGVGVDRLRKLEAACQHKEARGVECKLIRCRFMADGAM